MDNLNGKLIKETYTFDDVLLVPSYSEVLPNKVSLKTHLTKTITLNIPIVSAAMDTVTESSMAIALARQGGLGFIHKNMSIEEQANQVTMVKRSQSGMIIDPITLTINSTLKEAENILSKYKISGLPVIDENKKLLGIITNRDLRYRTLDDTKVEHIMTKENLITGHEGITLDEAKEILLKNKIEKLPIVNKEGLLTGLITIKDIDNVINYPNSCRDYQGRLMVGAAVGVSDDLMARVNELVKAQVDIIALDSAHGHSKNVIEAIKTIKKQYPNLPLIAGNIVTKEGAKALIEAGVDCVKVGIGPGSICTTRVIAGVGVPQISAINEVYQYCKDKNVSVIADGGIKNSGDIPKAIAAGADVVMLGSLLAGCQEAPGDEIIYEGRKFKVYVGMGSLTAMKRGSKDRYFQSQAQKLVPEGIEGRVPFKGMLADTIFQLCGGLRSGMGYCGCQNIDELKTKANFIKISNAGLKESHPHDVEITQEAPNYRK